MVLTSYYSTLFKKHALYELNPFNFIETRFSTKIFSYLVNNPVHLRRMCVLMLWGMSCKYQLGQVG